MKKISIIDFGTSNLKSINAAFNLNNIESIITNSPKIIESSDAVVLPGVGAFSQSMNFLRKHKIDKAIIKVIKKDTPFLGICLGMQLLFESSEEFIHCSGLGVLNGKIKNLKRFKTKNKMIVPNTGWHKLNKNQKFKKKNLLNLKNNKLYYFTHSFFAEPLNKSIISSTIKINGVEVCSSIQKKNIFAFQFHPEKSGPDGLDLIKNFCKII